MILDFASGIPDNLTNVAKEYIDIEKNILPEARETVRLLENRKKILKAVLDSALPEIGIDGVSVNGFRVTLKPKTVFNVKKGEYEKAKKFVIENDMDFLIKEGFDMRSFSKAMSEHFQDNDDIPDCLEKHTVTFISCTKDS